MPYGRVRAMEAFKGDALQNILTATAIIREFPKQYLTPRKATIISAYSPLERPPSTKPFNLRPILTWHHYVQCRPFLLGGLGITDTIRANAFELTGTDLDPNILYDRQLSL
jgi:hypothetical protein